MSAQLALRPVSVKRLKPAQLALRPVSVKRLKPPKPSEREQGRHSTRFTLLRLPVYKPTRSCLYSMLLLDV